MNTFQHITLTTTDEVTLAALYLDAGKEKFAILLHMMPATKESWEPFMEKLAEAGYSSIAIDARGHGESTMNGTLNYKEFTDKDHQAKIHDAEAAFAFLKGKGAVEANTMIMGASIGANLAIQFLTRHSVMGSAVALSPGLNYHGVMTETLMDVLASHQSILLMASDDDPESFQSVQRLHEMRPDQTTLRLQNGIGHGTTILEKKPVLMDEIIQWIQETK